MIITRRFIFIHNPKCAGTWAIAAIEQSHIQLFLRKTPLGDLLYTLGRWLPFLRTRIAGMINRLVIYNYGDYELGKLSYRNYYDPLGRRTLKWFIFAAEAMFILDKNYETLLKLRKHTRYAQLPRDFQALPIVSSIRDPFSWHLSRYQYYKSHQQGPGRDESYEFINTLGEIKDFEEYCNHKMMQLQNAFYQGYNNYISQQPQLEKEGELPQYHDELLSYYDKKQDKFPPASHYGLMTLRFMQLHFKRPWEAINLTPKEFSQYWANGDYKDNLPQIKFLQQQDIARQLHQYMLELKYKEEVLGAIKNLPPQNVSASSSSMANMQKFYSNRALIDYIYKLERPIFIMFPQYEEICRALRKNAAKG